METPKIGRIVLIPCQESERDGVIWYWRANPSRIGGCQSVCLRVSRYNQSSHCGTKTFWIPPIYWMPSTNETRVKWKG